MVCLLRRQLPSSMIHCRLLLMTPIIRSANTGTLQLGCPLAIACLLSHTRSEEKVYESSTRGLQPRIRGKSMKDKNKKSQDDLRPEYNFDYSKAVRGKYYKRLLEEGSNIIVLEPDVAKAFHDSAAVNEALRSLLDLTRSTQRLTRRSTGRS